MERIPKNIRQIGGREERIKAYLEDYVSTYLRKLQEEQEENGAAGVLVGSWLEEENPRCVFVNGAAQMSGAETGGGRLCVTEEAWQSIYESLGTYFSGQDLCGIFVCEGSCCRFRRQALFQAVRESFPDNTETLLYVLTEDGEEILYRVTKKNEERLQGYYCYFERNDAMQEYMMNNLTRRCVEQEELPGRRGHGLSASRLENLRAQSRQRQEAAEEGVTEPEREESSVQPWNIAGRGRTVEGSLGMPRSAEPPLEQREEDSKSKGDREDAGESPREGRSLFGLCAIMAAAVFAAGMIFLQRGEGGIQIGDILAKLQIDPSQLLEAGALPESTAQEETSSQASVVVEEIPGNVYPTEGDMPIASATGSQNPSESSDNGAGESASVPPEETLPPSSQPEEGTSTAVTGAETGGSEPASQPEESSGETESSAPPETAPTETVAEETTSAAPPETTSAAPPESTPASTGVTYVVQAGDSLYSISRKFYGTESMVSQIQELNGLSNADLIKEGQTLNLP